MAATYLLPNYNLYQDEERKKERKKERTNWNIKTIKFIMKKLLFLLLIALFNGSCKNEPETIPTPNNRDNLMLLTISYVDGEGEDLLNPTNQNGLTLNNLLLYYINDGKRKIALNSNNVPKQMSINCGETPNCFLLMFANDSTIIEMMGKDISVIDTICMEDKGNLIRYNGEVVYDSTNDSYGLPLITIVKEL